MKKSKLLETAKKFGTPAYIYDTTKISSQYKRLINSFNSVKKLQIYYAVKALSNLSILKFINSLGAGIDTVSIQEVIIGIKAGFSPEKIIYTPNSVSIDEISKVSKMGVKINIDNLNLLEQFGNLYPEIPVCIRINPHVMAGGNNKISVGHIDSKFGISIH
ncbi:MAG: diaminopimelate decarboxylase, partial [Flavobacteriaceae bacterium]|nr:diaminopimelate decarboxylase [Flavobacteriaceae bacterium]